MQLPWLSTEPDAPFPPVDSALRDPDGLLAAGGDLSVPRLLNAYAHGVFPWFSDGQPILWWSPDPRMVFDTDGVRLSSRTRRSLRGSGWRLRADTAFAAVLAGSAGAPRPGQDGTWITADMALAYQRLHAAGHAHSVEVFDGEALVGGIYGVAIGRMFFGESMFSRASGASKAALAGLAGFLHERGCPLIDAQVESAHLRSMGARLLPRTAFVRQVGELAREPGTTGNWSCLFGERCVAGLAGAVRGDKQVD